MAQYIFVTFLPGAGGNFIGRCLNLLSGFHTFVKPDDSMPTDTMEKLAVLDYVSVLNYGSNVKLKNWCGFEQNLKPYNSNKSHCALLDNEVGVFITHPAPKAWYDQYIGEDDKVFSFYMDETDVYDWVIVNAYHKDSHQRQFWFDNANIISHDPLVNKISLKNIIADQDGFFSEFEKICTIIGHTLTVVEKQALEILYNNWKTTSIPIADVEQYKQTIINAITQEYQEKLSWLNNKK